MSVFIMIGAAAICEGVTETTKKCLDKAVDALINHIEVCERKKMRKRKERREFV